MVAVAQIDEIEQVDGRGRPSGYDESFPARIKILAQNGATEREMAEHLDVSESTFKRWTHKHAELWIAMKLGKEACDDRVVHALYRRAVGYTYDSEKIFQHKGEPVVVPCVEHVPPSEAAATFWLKNRRPKEWKERQEIDTTVTHQIGDSVFELLSGIRSEASQVIDVPVDSGELVLEPLPIEPAPIPTQETPEEIC